MTEATMEKTEDSIVKVLEEYAPISIDSREKIDLLTDTQVSDVLYDIINHGKYTAHEGAAVEFIVKKYPQIGSLFEEDIKIYQNSILR